MTSVDVRMKFSEAQLKALDGYLDALYEQVGLRVSRSQAIRDMIGRQLRAAGHEWPDDPQHGGDRRSGRQANMQE